jgi:RND superfamily putative drug exporter
MAMFFSPSLTALIGRRAWWPGHSGGYERYDQRSGSESTL